MNEQALTQTILMVLGILVLIKSVWGLAHPASMKRVANWWLKAVLQVNTLCGIGCIIVAVGLWIAILVDQPLTNWILFIFGAVFAWSATIYFNPQQIEKVIKRLCSDRSLAALRVMSAVTAVIGLLLIYVAYKRL